MSNFPPCAPAHLLLPLPSRVIFEACRQLAQILRISWNIGTRACFSNAAETTRKIVKSVLTWIDLFVFHCASNISTLSESGSSQNSCRKCRKVVLSRGVNVCTSKCVRDQCVLLSNTKKVCRRLLSLRSIDFFC